MSDLHIQDRDKVGDGVTFRLATTRYRWLKRLLKAGVVLVVAMTLLRLAWGWEADRRLRAEIEKYVAAGGPVFAEDFDALAQAVPDADNAAVFFERAVTKVVPNLNSGVTITDFLHDPELFESNAADAAQLIALNAEALSLARRAGKRSQAAWSEPIAGRATRPVSGLRNGQRSLAKLLCLSADFYARKGNYAEAVTSAHDLIALGDAVEARPTFIAGMVAWAIQSLSYECVLRIGPGLFADDAVARNDQATHEDARGRTHDLIVLLLDSEASQGRLRRIYLGERACDLELRKGIDAGTSTGLPARGPLFTRVVMSPLLKLDLARSMQSWSLCASAAWEPSYPRFVTHLPVAEEPPASLVLDSIAHPYTTRRLWITRIAVETYFKQLAKRRMAALMLAIRLYEVDHGRRSEALADLVPAYLPFLPIDPFSPDGEGFHYAPEAPAPCVYSVGVDGEDDGGAVIRVRRGSSTDD